LAYGGILCPPYTAARALLEWAIDLWPYVNGKGLVSGLTLKEMSASEMIDVLHFFFEEDLFASSAEEIEAKSSIRSTIYETMYGEEYKYKYKSSSKNGSANGQSFGEDNFYGEDLAPFDPSAPPKPTKPYVPTTDFDDASPLPFGETLDAPLG
jgi:hypothetical protein